MSCQDVVARLLHDTEEASLAALDLDVACEQGETEACDALAFFLLDGDDVPRDPARAVSLLDAACARGRVEGCARLGQHIASLPASPADGRALGALERACEGAEVESCVRAGDLVRSGRGTTRDLSRALVLHRRGCEGGSDLGCRRVADHYVGSDDRASLVALYREMCDGGRARGCTLLGDVFARGGSDVETHEIGVLFGRGCDGGDVDGCVHAARLLASGEHGTAPDPGRAHTLLEDACRADRFDACAELGRLLELGVGGSRDVARARELYERACDHRSGVGCHRFASTLKSARGHHDEARILTLLRAACDSGESEQACGSIAAAYDMGRGVTADRAQAVPLYLRACDGGHADSCVRLAALVEAGDGTPEDPARAASYRQRACQLSPNEDRCEVSVLSTARSFGGHVTTGSGRGAPRQGAHCSVVLDRRMEPSACFIRVRCAGADLYGASGGWSSCALERAQTRADDLRTSPFDGTPQLMLDSDLGTLRIADVGPRARPLLVEMELSAAP